MKKKRKKTINVIPTGKNLLETFIQERFKENSIADSYNPVKEMNLKAFSFMKKVVKVHVKDLIIPINAHSEFFGSL